MGVTAEGGTPNRSVPFSPRLGCWSDRREVAIVDEGQPGERLHCRNAELVFPKQPLLRGRVRRGGGRFEPPVGKYELVVVRRGALDSDQRILTLLAQVGRTLGMDVVAEGVETPLDTERARAAGCDRFQGFLYARPLTPAALEAGFSIPQLASATWA